MTTHDKLIEDCQFAALWNHPLSGWPTPQIKGLYKLVTRLATDTVGCTVSIRSWRRLAYLAGCRPTGRTTPADIFGTISNAETYLTEYGHPI